jgi:hypothetical protein
MTSRSEDVLIALIDRLRQLPDIGVERNSALPERIPNGGLVILRDGDPGEPEQALGGFAPVYYRHAVDLEIYAESGDQGTRDQIFDDLATSIGAALEADPTLGGLVFGMSYGRPQIVTEAVGGGPAIKTGTITLVLDYETPSPLG